MLIKTIPRRSCFLFALAAATLLPSALGLRAAEVTEQHFFQTSDRCIACHSGMTSSSGRDISIGYAWRASMMANSARDPYWHAAVRREVLEHPEARAEIEDECSTCHMPMARYAARQQGARGRVFANLVATDGNPFALDGVSCTVCHQVSDRNLGETSSFSGGFIIDPEDAAGGRMLYGPHVVDSGRRRLMTSATTMQSQTSAHLQSSELCATCHTLYTHALGNSEGGAALPEQVPYLEWKHSEFATTRSCQDCHMPELAEEAPITSVLGIPRPHFSQHVFRGGNAFMLGILERHRGELGVPALAQELDASLARTVEYLEEATARVSVSDAALDAARLAFDVSVESLAGHKLPTAYPSRRVWLHVTVTDAEGRLRFESGAVRADGSIAGNDNDVDAALFEPHFRVIDSPDQVQIYEAVLVDAEDRVTTGLLSAVRYVKDNRLLPRGFDKRLATPDIAVRGEAFEDQDFEAGGDKIRYEIGLDVPTDAVNIAVEVLYESIGYRWAENLRGFDAAETNRFVTYYAEAAGSAAVRLAETRLRVD